MESHSNTTRLAFRSSALEVSKGCPRDHNRVGFKVQDIDYSTRSLHPKRLVRQVTCSVFERSSDVNAKASKAPKYLENRESFRPNIRTCFILRTRLRGYTMAIRFCGISKLYSSIQEPVGSFRKSTGNNSNSCSRP